MSEPRVVSTTYGVGGFDPSKPNNNIVEELTEEISDEELAQEQIEQDSNDAIHTIKAKYDIWDSLTSSQQKAVVKDLLICMLNLYKGQY